MEGHALPRQKKQFHPSALAEEKLLWKESWEMSQIILFDLDGTLTESGEGITKCVQYALSRFGIQEPDLEKLRCFVGPPLLESFMEYAGLSREDAEKAVEYYQLAAGQIVPFTDQDLGSQGGGSLGGAEAGGTSADN